MSNGKFLGWSWDSECCSFTMCVVNGSYALSYAMVMLSVSAFAFRSVTQHLLKLLLFSGIIIFVNHLL